MLRLSRFKSNVVIQVLLIAGLLVVTGAPVAQAATPALTWSWEGDYEAFTETGDNDGEFEKGDNYLKVELDDGEEFALSDDTEMEEGDEYELTGTLPDDLELHVLQVDENTVEIWMEGTADDHTTADNVDGLYIEFLDDAFDGGDADDVDDVKSDELEIHFCNAVMTFDPNPMTFNESSDNDGSIDEDDVLKVTLDGDDEFVDDDFEEGTHFETDNVPDGLEVVVDRVDDDELEITLDGEADDHDATDNTEIEITFTDDAFESDDADGIVFEESPVIKVKFGNETSINWSASEFVESAADDGSIDTVLVAKLASPDDDEDEDGESFTGPKNEVMADDLYEVSNVPDGLEVQIFKSSDTRVEVRLLGQADDHAASDSISNMSIEFLDEAFSGEDASAVANSKKTGISVSFTGGTSSTPDNNGDGLPPVVSTFKLNQTNYVVNGTSYQMDASPFAQDNRTFVPLRYLGYALGMGEEQIIWENSSQRAFLTQGDKTVYVQIGSQWLTENDHSTLMDVTPLVVNERVFLPARFVAEAFGATVEWVGATSTVIISRQ